MANWLSPQDNLANFSFAGMTFPVLEYEVEGALRDHVHEYSHQDGGDPEKLGRKLYVIRATINAKAHLRGYDPLLWPDALNDLMQKWELGGSHSLIVPDIGEIIAYAYRWSRKWSARVRSGITCTVEFREDATNLPLPIVISSPSPKAMGTTVSNLSAIAASKNLNAATNSLIGSINQLVQSIQSIGDTVSLLGQQVLLQCQQLISLCAQADKMASFQTAANADLMRALHDLWSQAVSFANDLQQQNQPLLRWITPTLMSISGVSTAIYGDSTHVSDLLSLNTGAFVDANQIPANTVLVYYPVATNASSISSGVTSSLLLPH